MKSSLALLLALIALLHSSTAFAETWATLKGRFVFEGEPPKQKLLAIPAKTRANHGLPADFRLPDERVLVDNETKGIANILVFAAHDRTGSQTPMPYFDDHKEEPPSEHVIQFQNLAYSPRISFMRTSQKLLFVNASAVPTIIQYQPPSEKKTQLQINTGGRVAWNFGKPMPTPIYIDHGINDALSAWVLVRDNPYVVLTNSKGEFEIKNLPVGAWQFVAWHEKSQEKLLVTIDGKEEEWKKGEFTATIDKKGTDLGEMKIDARNFK